MSKPDALFELTDTMADLRAEASKFAFSIGVRMLVAAGSTEPSARSFLGKRMREIGKPALMRAIIHAAFAEVVEPRSYLASIQAPTAASGAIRVGDDDASSDGIQPWMA